MRSISRLCVLKIALPLAAMVALAMPATAEDYPSRTVKFIVPFGAGGPADVYARVLAQHLGDVLKGTFVVEDRPGAGSIIGTNEVAKATPDGYTLLVMSNTHTTNESLIANKPFQLMRDFWAVPEYDDMMKACQREFCAVFQDGADPAEAARQVQAEHEAILRKSLKRRGDR